jgi:hypothetical protein
LGTNTPLVPNENGEVEFSISYLEEDNQLPVIDVESDTGVRVYLIELMFSFLLKKNKNKNKKIKNKIFFLAYCCENY